MREISQSSGFLWDFDISGSSKKLMFFDIPYNVETRELTRIKIHGGATAAGILDELGVRNIREIRGLIILLFPQK